jgi:CRP-like cAMP-binding protein
MYVKQSELFAGTSMDFVQKFMNVSQMISHQNGDVIFQENDKALHFFILLSGRVRLTIGEDRHAVYDAHRTGEAFGWSSLIGRDVYSASAHCIEATKLLRIDSKKFSGILNNDAPNSSIFFKHLAATLGNRLLESYKIITPDQEET